MKDNNQLKTFMDENEDFKNYVIKNCRTYGWTIEQALRIKEVKEYAKYLQGGFEDDDRK